MVTYIFVWFTIIGIISWVLGSAIERKAMKKGYQENKASLVKGFILSVILWPAMWASIIYRRYFRLKKKSNAICYKCKKLVSTTLCRRTALYKEKDSNGTCIFALTMPQLLVYVCDECDSIVSTPHRHIMVE